MGFGVIQHPLEIDDDGGLIAFDPRVVARGQEGDIAGPARELTSIIHAHGQHP